MNKQTYQIRWRGKVSGPFALDALHSMLARNEVSLMHEALVEGQWISLEELIARTHRAAPAPPAEPPQEPAPPPSPPQPPGPPPIPPEELFYVAKGGQQQGPHTRSVLRQLAAAGVVANDDLVWREGMPEWMQLGRLMPDLPRAAVAPPFAPGPPRGPSPPPPGPPAPVHETGGNGAVAGGYICSLIALAIFPPFFSLAAFVCGIVALVKGKLGHGIAILLLSLVCGFLGMALGAAAFNE